MTEREPHRTSGSTCKRSSAIWRPQDVPAQALELVAVAGRHADGSLQIEPRIEAPYARAVAPADRCRTVEDRARAVHKAQLQFPARNMRFPLAPSTGPEIA
jgi:hypothetical protein